MLHEVLDPLFSQHGDLDTVLLENISDLFIIYDWIVDWFTQGIVLVLRNHLIDFLLLLQKVSKSAFWTAVVAALIGCAVGNGRERANEWDLGRLWNIHWGRRQRYRCSYLTAFGGTWLIISDVLSILSCVVCLIQSRERFFLSGSQAFRVVGNSLWLFL